MGPRRDGFWLPLLRLGAFAASVVACGNLLLHAANPSNDGAAQAPPEGRDYYTRKKKRIERQFRAIERFFEDSFHVPAPGPEGGAEEFEEDVETAAVLLPEPRIMLLKPELPSFAWPEAASMRSPREVDLPGVESPYDFSCATPELVALWCARGEEGFLPDLADALFLGPELLFDGVISLGQEVAPRAGSVHWKPGQSESIASRILDFSVEPRQGRIFSEFVGRLVEREQRFFARFDESYLNTSGFEDGNAEVDTPELLDEQRKVLWDVLRKTYLSKYKFRADERIRDEAFYFDQWRGVDFALVPPLVAGYVYYRGLDKDFKVSGTRVSLSIEPLRKWKSDADELVAGVTVDWRIDGWPVGIIVSAGLYDGDMEVDFVGIGTGLRMAKKALVLQREQEY